MLDTYIWRSRPRAPGAPEVMTPTCAAGDRTRSAEVCYTAGLNYAGCATRLRRRAKEAELEQVEGGDYCSPIHDGPGLRFGVIWKRYVSIVTHRKAFLRDGTILFKDSNDTVEQPRERMEDPVHVTLNTSPSAMSPCVNNGSGPNTVEPRSGAPTSLPRVA